MEKSLHLESDFPVHLAVEHFQFAEALGREKVTFGRLKYVWWVEFDDDTFGQAGCEAKGSEDLDDVPAGIIIQYDTELLCIWRNSQVARLQRSDASLGFSAIHRLVSKERAMKLDSLQHGWGNGVKADI